MAANRINLRASASRAGDYPIGDILRGERATLGKSLLDVQRELSIKASHIAAIENLDPAAFSNPALLPGFVRSYARYLGLDPEPSFQRFCVECGLKPAKPTRSGIFSSGARSRAWPLARSSAAAPLFPARFTLAAGGRRGRGEIRLSAIGSILVLACLAAGLGYGGWIVLNDIQRVQFAPVEDMPLAIAEIDKLPPAPDFSPSDPPSKDPLAVVDLADLYRHQEREAPVLVPRDGPIAAIDPDLVAPLVAKAEPDRRAGAGAGEVLSVSAENDAAFAADSDPLSSRDETARAVSGEAFEPRQLSVVVERAAWVRVYLANGTIIFERILQKGETYTPPEGVGAPLIWAGNSGSVYVRIGDELRGPLGRGTRAARDIVLDPVVIAERFARVEQVPEVISQATDVQASPSGAPIAIQ